MTDLQEKVRELEVERDQLAYKLDEIQLIVNSPLTFGQMVLRVRKTLKEGVPDELLEAQRQVLSCVLDIPGQLREAYKMPQGLIGWYNDFGKVVEAYMKVWDKREPK